MSVHDVDALAQQNVSEEGNGREYRREDTPIVEDEEGQVVDFETVAQPPDAAPLVICVCEHDNAMSKRDQTLAQVVDVCLHATRVRTEEVGDKTSMRLHCRLLYSMPPLTRLSVIESCRRAPLPFSQTIRFALTLPVAISSCLPSCRPVVELFYFRNGKMIYIRFRYRIRIITVFVLRMRIRRKVMLKLSSFFAFSAVSVLIKAYKSIGFVL